MELVAVDEGRSKERLLGQIRECDVSCWTRLVRIWIRETQSVCLRSFAQFAQPEESSEKYGDWSNLHATLQSVLKSNYGSSQSVASIYIKGMGTWLHSAFLSSELL
jgi:hypothetical protein